MGVLGGWTVSFGEVPVCTQAEEKKQGQAEKDTQKGS